MTLQYLHELKRCLKVLDRIHLHSEELQTHDEADGALDHAGVLLLLTELLQLTQKLLLHSSEPEAGQREEGRQDEIHERCVLSQPFFQLEFNGIMHGTK